MNGLECRGLGVQGLEFRGISMFPYLTLSQSIKDPILMGLRFRISLLGLRFQGFKFRFRGGGAGWLTVVLFQNPDYIIRAGDFSARSYRDPMQFSA